MRTLEDHSDTTTDWKRYKAQNFTSKHENQGNQFKKWLNDNKESLLVNTYKYENHAKILEH